MEIPAHILLVEDNRMDVELLLDAFHEAHLRNTIHVCLNGPDALDYLFGRGKYADRVKYPLPNIVLLDLKLPGVDGFEVLRQIKTTPMLKRLPVIILTSSREEGDRAMSYDNGANSYLVKPVAFGGAIHVGGEFTGEWNSQQRRHKTSLRTFSHAVCESRLGVVVAAISIACWNRPQK